MYNDQLVYMVVIWAFFGISLGKQKVALSMVTIHMTCFHMIFISLISNGDYPSVHYILCTLPLWALLLCSLIDGDYDITICNDFARDVHCDITMSTAILMCICHDITMHNDVAMSLLYNILGPKWVFRLAERGLGLNMTTECSFKNTVYATATPSKLGH